MVPMKSTRALVLSAALVGISVVFGVGPAAAHGPGGHGDNAFTALQAAEKGMELYNRLIADGKIEESWETAFSTVEVSTRGSGDAMEYVVRFDRKEGDPPSVFIFFDMEGNYTGSNFTGE